MKRRLETLVQAALSTAIARGELPPQAALPCTLEDPSHPVHGDATCRVAMAIARRTRLPATEIAAVIARRVDDRDGWLDAVEAAGPGFVNLRASRALLHAELAETLARLPVPTVAERTAVVVAIEPVTPRAAAIADTIARLLESTGTRVARSAVDPQRTKALAAVLGDGARCVCVAAGEVPGVVQRLKRARAASGADAGTLSLVAVAPVRVLRDGRRLDDAEAHAVLASDAGRFLLAGVPSAEVAELDARLLAGERIDNPLFAVGYALARIGRGAAAGTDRVDLAALDGAADECLRLVARSHDVLEQAARRLEPEAVAVHVRSVAAALHRYYNRTNPRAAEGGAARAALFRGVERVVRDGLAVLGVRADGVG
jgi:arginyl-tRNA synthetase